MSPEDLDVIESKKSQEGTRKVVKLYDYIQNKAAKKPSAAASPPSPASQGQATKENQVMPAVECSKDDVDKKMTGDEDFESSTTKASETALASALKRKREEDDNNEALPSKNITQKKALLGLHTKHTN